MRSWDLYSGLHDVVVARGCTDTTPCSVAQFSSSGIVQRRRVVQKTTVQRSTLLACVLACTVLWWLMGAPIPHLPFVFPRFPCAGEHILPRLLVQHVSAMMPQFSAVQYSTQIEARRCWMCMRSVIIQYTHVHVARHSTGAPALPECAGALSAADHVNIAQFSIIQYITPSFPAFLFPGMWTARRWSKKAAAW